MRYGLQISLRERSTPDLRQIKREVEISLPRMGSRQGKKDAERYLNQIDKELQRRVPLRKATASKPAVGEEFEG